MAEKRMFTQKIIDSDAFLEMPLSAQALYFHLNMRADDDGFVNNPKRVTKLVSASEDDLKILLIKRFIIGFASGVIVIKHWRMHNTLKSDRYHPTDYQEEFAQLGIKANKAYTDNPGKLIPKADGTKMEPEWNQNGTRLEPENRLGLGLDLEKSSKEEYVCAEPVPDSAPESICSPLPDTITTLILNDGTEFEVTEAYVNQMQSLFPAVDVIAEIKKMSAWCINNPQKRKTRRGVRAFINNWLSREQDRGSRRDATWTGNATDRPPKQQRPSKGVDAVSDLLSLHKKYEEKQ